MADTELGFDHPEVNVDLAKQYLKENEDDIKNITELKKKDVGSWDFVPRKREILANKIKENSKLICQLEYLTNNTPIEDTEKNIELMLQYLSMPKKYRITATSLSVTVFKSTPLALLAHVIDLSELAVCEERRAVCHLIIKLCEAAGLWLNVKINVIACPGDNTDLNNIPGCIGIVSEKSDLDSAIDAFLSSSSSSHCFWRTRKILVQESIYQSFKELIEFKAKLKGSKSGDHDELRKLCSDLFVYKQKVLLFDYAGDVDALRLKSAHIITIEAYRTNKELLSLVGDNARAGFVSLWCADVSEANEIAYKIPTSLVWINDLANFNGPSEISTCLINSLLTNHFVTEDIAKTFIDNYKIWKTFDNKKRANIISDVVENVKDAASDEGRKSKMLTLLQIISDLKFNAVEVADGKMCVTLDSPVGINYNDELDSDVIASLVIGNGVLFRSWTMEKKSDLLYYDLERAGVPIWECNRFYDTEKAIRCYPFRYGTKVIVTNYGTIFAN